MKCRLFDKLQDISKIDKQKDNTYLNRRVGSNGIIEVEKSWIKQEKIRGRTGGLALRVADGCKVALPDGSHRIR